MKPFRLLVAQKDRVETINVVRKVDEMFAVAARHEHRRRHDGVGVDFVATRG